ncbi:hypothetical protein [Streptomyces ardesiacus]|uniref:hypothetical protein n=1 Tax=Streptomyces ardesiacus TaxID=285564 RepID=UPI0037F18823
MVVFSNEVTPLTTYRDPYGCQKLPADAHEINNLSDGPVTLYGDPFCMTPSMTVQPGHGSHVSPGSGSFSAE